jgi:serine protease Do
MAMLFRVGVSATAQDGGQEISGAAAAAAIEQQFVKVIEQSEASVVSIARVRRAEPVRLADQLNPLELDLQRPSPESERPESVDFVPNDFGTGVIVAAEGNAAERYILTNYHVVAGGPVDGKTEGDRTELYVRFSNRRGYRASIRAADPRSDLAVLAINFSELGLRPDDLTPIKLGDGSSVRKGQLVVALGNPYAIARDGSASASWGFVSNVGRRPAPVGRLDDPETLDKQTIHHFGTLLTVDTRLNLGTSGGALLNLHGELIGITTSLAALEGYEQSVGYAIPIDGATRRVIQALIQGHEVEYGFLGVAPRTVSRDELRRQFSMRMQPTAAMADIVFPNSPASVAGLQQGDLVLEIDGKAVRDTYDLMLFVGRAGPEAPCKLRVWRERLGRELVLNANLGKWPVRNDEGIVATVPRYSDWRGLRVDYPTGRAKFFPPPHQIPQAVLVTDVKPRSSAAVAELQAGDFISQVNGRPVQTPAQFQRAVQGVDGEATIELSDGRRVVVRP